MRNKLRTFNGKTFYLHGEYGTMIDVRSEAENLKQDGFKVRIVSRGYSASGAKIYKTR